MYTATRRSLKSLAAALVLFAAAGPLALADTDVFSTTLAGPLAGGTTVQVGVTNLGDSPASGIVSVQAVVGGMLATGYAQVYLLPGQSTIVVVPFSAPVQGVLDAATTTTSSTTPTMMGVIDESTPF